MATYWENSCSFGLRYVSWYKYLIVSLVFSHLGFWSGNLFLIAPFPDLCLLVPSAHNFHIINKPLPKQNRTVHDDAAQPFLICQQLCRMIRDYTQKDLLNVVNIGRSNRLQPGAVEQKMLQILRRNLTD